MSRLLALTAAAALALPASAPPALSQATPYIGAIHWFGSNFCPRGWAPVNGALLAISSNTAFFSLVGTTYGGDGRTTFQIPDLRGRTPVHFGTGPGLSEVRLGEKIGLEQVTLTVPTMASHTHSVTVGASTASGSNTLASGNILGGGPYYAGALASADVALNAATIEVGATGGNTPVSVMDPFVVMRACVATQGVFPPRN